jgi:organic radical activating enzyme
MPNPEVTWADEAKYVLTAGQPLPENPIEAQHYLISPAWEPDGSLKLETAQWCMKLVRENPQWRLSVQYHKIWDIP